MLRLNLPCRDYWMPRIKAGHDSREVEMLADLTGRRLPGSHLQPRSSRRSSSRTPRTLTKYRENPLTPHPS